MRPFYRVILHLDLHLIWTLARGSCDGLSRSVHAFPFYVVLLLTIYPKSHYHVLFNNDAGL